MTHIDGILKERGQNYGNYFDHATLTQNIKRAMRSTNQFDLLDDDMQETCDMLAHKLGRIINGDKYYLDSWDDMIGYVQLIIDRIREGKLT